MSYPFVRLDSVCDFLAGNAWKSGGFSSDSKGLPVIRIQNVGNIVGDLVFWAGEYDPRYIVDNGDILLSLSGNVKLSVWRSGKALLNQRVVKLVPSSQVDQGYFYWAIHRAIEEISNMAKHAVIANVSMGDLRGLEIPFPPLPEQRRIAAILEKADAIRRMRQESIRLTEEFLRSTFLEMFGDPVTNPKGWEVVKLKETFDLKPQIGTIVPAGEIGEQLAVRVGEIGGIDIALNRCKSVTLSDKERDKFLLREGDFLLARAIGSVDHLGKASLFTGASKPVVFDSHVMRLRFKHNVLHSIFFFEWMRSKGGKSLFMNQAGQTAVQFNVNSEQIGAINIPLPPYGKQHEFISIFEKVRAINYNSSMVLENNNKLFDSLVHRAFRGEL